jgi:hypothetical protein
MERFRSHFFLRIRYCSAVSLDKFGPALMLNNGHEPSQPERRSWSWLILSFVAIFLLALPAIPDRLGDSGHYLNIAHGMQVPKPFSNRILLPMAARTLSQLTHADVETCFLAIAVFIYVAILLVLGIFSDLLKMDRRLLAAIWIVPSLAATLAQVYSPDLASVLWILVIFLAIAAELPILAALLFIPAIMTRETNVLFGALTIVLFFSQRRYRAAATTVAAMAVGFWLAAKLSFGSQGNVHEMNSVVYMLLKVPVNFISNLLGIAFWTDSYHQWCAKPTASIPLPTLLHFGSMTRIGVCSIDGEALIVGWLPYFSVFGIGTGLLSALCAPVISMRRQVPGVILLAFGYGILMFIIGPMSGKAVLRLTFYGWPAFLIALPYFLGRFISFDRSTLTFLVVLHVLCLCAAISVLIGRAPLPLLSNLVSDASARAIALSVGLITNLIAFVIVRRRYSVRDVMQPAVGARTVTQA